jgi:hypothetical protein
MATAVKKWQMHPIKQKKCQYLIYINQWLRIGLRGCKGLPVGVGGVKAGDVLTDYPDRQSQALIYQLAKQGLLL